MIQPQGVTIPISIFGDAIQAGVTAGNQQKTMLQSITEGAVSGIEKAQDFRLKSAQIDLTQKRAEAEALELEKAKIETEAVVSNADQVIATKKAELEASQAVNEQKAQAAQLAKEFGDLYPSATPQQKVEMLLGGRYEPAFAVNPRLRENAGNTALANKWFTPEQADAFSRSTRKANALSYHEKRQQQYIEDASAKEKILFGSPAYDRAMQAAGLSPTTGWEKIRFRRAGEFEYDPETGEMLFGADGKPLPGANYDNKTKSWDVLVGNKRVLSNDEDSGDLRKLVASYTQARALVDGKVLQQDLADIDSEGRQKQEDIQVDPNKKVEVQEFVSPAEQEAAPLEAKQKVTIPPGVYPNPGLVQAIRGVDIKAKEGTINLTGNPEAYRVAQGTLGVKDEEFKRIKPTVRDLFGSLERPPAGRGGTRTEEQMQSIIENRDKIVAELGSIEYQTDPIAKSLYTQIDVVEHNKEVDNFLARMQYKPGAGLGMPILMPSGIGVGQAFDESKLIKVSTPEELCQIKTAKGYREVVDSLIGTYENHMRFTKRAAEVFKGSVNTAKDILAK